MPLNNCANNILKLKMILIFILLSCSKTKSESGVRFDMFKWLTDLEDNVYKLLVSPQFDGDEVFKDLSCYNGYLYHLGVMDRFYAPVEEAIAIGLNERNPDGPKFTKCDLQVEEYKRFYEWVDKDIDELKKLIAETSVLWNKTLTNFFGEKTVNPRKRKKMKVFI